MNDQGQPQKPTGTFAKAMEAEPLAGASASAKQLVELFSDGVSIGWLGQDSGQWCIAVSKDKAVAIEAYVWKGVTYFRNSADTSRYLSVSDGYHYVGFYNWIGARGWKIENNHMVSLYTNAPLAYYSSSDNFLYANNDYKRLTVKFHA